MACCSLLIYLVSLLVKRRHPVDERPESAVIMWIAEQPTGASLARLAALALSELAAAFAFVIWLHGSASTRMAHMVTTPAASWTWPVNFGAAMAMSILIAGYWVLVATPDQRPSHVHFTCWSVGAVTLLVGLSAPMSRSAASSHLAMMAQLELLATVGPLLLVLGAAPLRKPRPERATPLALLSGLVAAIVWIGSVYWWHLAASSGSAPALTFLVRPASYLAAGWLLWSASLGAFAAAAPYRGRFMRLLLTQEAVAVLGLALLLSPTPLFVMHASALSPLADQRAAGALMMAVDAVCALPVLRWLALRAAQSGLPVLSQRAVPPTRLSRSV